MIKSLADVPPEVFCQITDNLPRIQDVQSLALTSKGLRASCAPALYREVAYGSTPWKELFKRPAVGLPIWSRHVRIIRCSEPKSVNVDFRSVVPVLKNLQGLRKFTWEPSIDINEIGELSLRHSEELHLALESAYGAPERGGEGPSWSHGMARPTSPQRHLNSPFNSLATLSESHPRLRCLSLRLNHPAVYEVTTRTLALAPADPVLRNVFPRLTHFSLKGLLDLPMQATLSSFVVAHASLRSFTCHTYDNSLTFPDEAFPQLEYLEGSVDLLAAVCDSSASPRRTLIEIRGIRVFKTDDVPEIYAKRVFPKLPNLTKVYLGFDHPITPEWVHRLGERCPKLVTFSLHDPRWIGTESNFAHAFSAFKHLRYLSTSRHFIEAHRGVGWTSPFPTEDSGLSLAVAVARSASRLAEITWGNEKRVHAGWEARIPRVTSVCVERREADDGNVDLVELDASVASTRFA